MKAENEEKEENRDKTIESMSEEELFLRIKGIPGAVMRDNPRNIGFIRMDQEDIHQELLLESVRAIRSFRKKDPESMDGLSTYVYHACEFRLKEITRQQNFDRYRADATSVNMDAIYIDSDDGEQVRFQPAADDEVLTEVLIADLYLCLSERQRYILDGIRNKLSFSEIARELNISRNAVRYHAVQIGLKAPWLREALKNN